MEEENEFYLRYYVGHKGKFGHEFLEFEFRPDGKLRYANNSNYKNDTMIRKEVFLTPAVLKECKRIVSESEIMKEDDFKWPEPDRVGRQELEIVMGNEHISFATSKIGSLVDVQSSDDPEGLRIFYYLVQDDSYVESYISTIGVDFKIRTVEQDGKTIKLQISQWCDLILFSGTLLVKSASGLLLAVITVAHMGGGFPCRMAFADEIGIPFMETSAKDATNVEQAFMAMSASIKESMASQPAGNNARTPTVQIRGQPVAQKNGCCST
uniref:Uncharacterized protein n=1 Tax=Brassica campestris TaxID=3711 RepID=M4EV35_BRACM